MISRHDLCEWLDVPTDPDDADDVFDAALSAVVNDIPEDRLETLPTLLENGKSASFESSYRDGHACLVVHPSEGDGEEVGVETLVSRNF